MVVFPEPAGPTSSIINPLFLDIDIIIIVDNP
jgi:hypothetical protein